MSKNYVKINIKDLKAPIGCWGDLYTKLGIIDIFYDRAEELKIGHKNYILPQHILCNDRTFDKLIALIRESWIWYGIDRRTGKLKKRSTEARHKNPKKLTRSDEGALGMDALGWSPSTVLGDEVPDDEIWLDLDLKPIHPVEGE